MNHPPSLVVLFIASIFLAGCVSPAANSGTTTLSGEAVLFGTWTAPTLDNATITFNDNHTVALSPEFGCMVPARKAETDGSTCMKVTAKYTNWNTSGNITVGRKAEVLGISVENETLEYPLYAIVSYDGKEEVWSNQCASPGDCWKATYTTVVFRFDRGTDTLQVWTDDGANGTAAMNDRWIRA